MDGLEGLLPLLYNSLFAPRRPQPASSPQGSICSAFRDGRNGSLKVLLRQSSGEYCPSDSGTIGDSKQYGRASDAASGGLKTHIIHGREGATCLDDFYYPLDWSPRAAAAH